MSNNVLLINLPISNNMKEGFKNSNSMPPLGLLYIAGYLKSKKVDYEIIDFAITSLTKKQFIEYLTEQSPKIIGISTYNECWTSQKILSRLIRSILPEAVIVAGGAFATFCYEDMFKENVVDYVIRGEGELSFFELYKYLIKGKNKKLEDIPGLVYKRGGKIIANKIDRITDLDKLPFPDRTKIDLKKYTLGYTISTARGCPGRCIFCSSKAFWGKNIYFRSADSIFDEVLEVYNSYNQSIIYFADDAFTLNKKRAVEFCEKVKKSKISFLFGFESRADVLDEDFIQLLYESGFKKIQIGLESADNDILRKLKKNVTIEQIESAIKLASEYNMHVSVSYIIGHAFDTHETVRKTIDFVRYIQKEYNAYTMGSVNTPFPGTEQYNNLSELGMQVYSNDWNDYRLNYPIISTKNINRDEIREYFEEIQNINIISNT